MAKFLVLLIVLVGIYAALYAAGEKGRAATWRAVRPHLVPVAAIVAVLLFIASISGVHFNLF